MRDHEAEVKLYSVEEQRVKEYYTDFEDRLNGYSEFLQEGDFERYQPFCYSPILNTPMFNLMKLFVDELDIYEPTLTRTEIRRMAWIKSRFEVYGSKTWYDLILRTWVYRR